MDVTPYLELKTAPQVLFDALPERGARVRFMVPTNDGDWRAVTYHGLARQVRDLTLFLAGLGLRTGDRAAIFAPNRVEWFAAALAIQAAGGVMVPVYGSNTTAQAAYVVRHADARVLFVDTAPLLGRVLEAFDEYAQVERIVLLDDDLDPAAVLAELRARGASAPAWADVERRVVTWSQARHGGAARAAEDPQALDRLLGALSLDQPGLMLYTSGTTGNPKGVPLTHRNVGQNGQDWLMCNAPLLDEGQVDILWLPMSHIYGLGEASLGNTLGFVTYLSDPVRVMARLPEVRPQVFMSVPSVWEKLATAARAEAHPERRRRKLLELTGGRLRFCLSGGAGLKREVKELFHECGILIIEGYGLTESSPTLTLNRPDAFRFDSVGRALPSVQLRLAEDGEILARGPNVFAGYHKDPAATTEIFTADGWLKTGDIGRLTDDGFLQIVDRKKDILVTAGGKNVPPQNIELRFAADPFIAHLVVHGDGERFLVAGVWLDEAAVKAALDEQGVTPDSRPAAIEALVQRRIDRVNAELASYETIKRFRVMGTPLTVNDGLLTPTLKVRRRQVYQQYAAEFAELHR
ncbi:MAG: AMP-binding protein [Deltaproteobacteria bacterium]|nr:AMP-binding protein [Deltaproteobacteria bacterium]